MLLSKSYARQRSGLIDLYRAAKTLKAGVMGGSNDTTYLATADHEGNMVSLIQQEGDWPRIMHTGSSTPLGNHMQNGGEVYFESGIPELTKKALQEKGHFINKKEGIFGGYQGIWREDIPLRYFGGSDPRKDGCAIGY